MSVGKCLMDVWCNFDTLLKNLVCPFPLFALWAECSLFLPIVVDVLSPTLDQFPKQYKRSPTHYKRTHTHSGDFSIHYSRSSTHSKRSPTHYKGSPTYYKRSPKHYKGSSKQYKGYPEHSENFLTKDPTLITRGHNRRFLLCLKA